ncbi:protein required for attachment to host cells [Bradyrhizobium sp. USDA 3686]|nr:protein required for attachment to host cells [Bradyrhizobium canariense]
MSWLARWLWSCAMDQMRIDKGDWLVVCDGRKALIRKTSATRCFRTSTPGRCTNSPIPRPVRKGPTRRAGSTARPVARAARWSRLIGTTRPSAPSCAAWPDGSMPPSAQARTSALTMVASPRALGMIRADCSDVVRKALQGEVGKDLVKLPVYEIEKQLLLSAPPNSGPRRGPACTPQKQGCRRRSWPT